MKSKSFQQATDEAIALGFQSAQAAADHSAWLEKNGTSEYRAWLSDIKAASKAQEKRIAAALQAFGHDRCVQAYTMNVIEGEGGTVIEINTGIPKRNQGSAILAGEFLSNNSQA